MGDRSKWIIPSTFSDWDSVTTSFTTQWNLIQDDLEELLLRGDLTKKEKANALYKGFKSVYDMTMIRFFKKESRSHSWKPWITGDIRKAIIEFHKFERLLNNRNIPRGQAFWSTFKKLRKKRDKLLKRRKREWITNKFSEHGLEGKDGWAIAAEVRNIGKSAVNIIPDIHTADGILTNTKDKADAFNRHYHRFDEEPDIPLWPYHEEERLEEFGYDSESDLKEVLDDLEAPDIDFERRGEAFALQQQKLLGCIKDVSCIFHRIRKFRCASKHSLQLAKLNSHILEAEVRRAVCGFSSGKSAGPDDIYIGIIKKCKDAVIPILTWIYDKIFFEIQWIPDGMKERYIIPLCKPGKAANQASSYRPISLTSYLAKILEKVLTCRLVSYLIHLRLLSDCHYAYLKGRGTQDAVAFLLEQITHNAHE